MNTSIRPYASPNSVAPQYRKVRNSDPYPVFKIMLAFAAAPAIAGMLTMMILGLASLQPAALVLTPLVMLFAEILFVIPALLTGIIICIFRWQKDDLDPLKAAAVGAMCAFVPTMLFSPPAAFFMGIIAALVTLLLAYLVLPNAEYLGFPIYQHPEPDYWAVEIPTLEDQTKSSPAQTGFYYLKDLPQTHKH